MNILGVQLILVFFGLFMIYFVFIHWKKKEISDLLFFIWFFVWLVFIFFAFFPLLLQPLIEKLFIVRVMDLGMILAFMVLTYLSIENNIRIRGYQKQLENLVRKLAIR